MTNKQIINQIIQKAQIGVLIIRSINDGVNEHQDIIGIVCAELPDASIVDVTKAIMKLQDENLIERIGKINVKGNLKYLEACNLDPFQTKVKMPVSKYRITETFLTLAKQTV